MKQLAPAYIAVKSHLASVGQICIAKYADKNKYSMVIQGEHDRQNALLFF